MLERLLKVIGDYEIIEKTVPTASTLTFLDLEIRMKEQRVYLNNKHIPLNQREFMVLCHLTSHPKWVFSKKDIYRAVWNEEPVNYENTVMCCISQLRKKIEPDPRHPKYIHTVRGVGYKFEPLSEE